MIMLFQIIRALVMIMAAAGMSRRMSIGQHCPPAAADHGLLRWSACLCVGIKR
jgi:hypothetical protein